MTIESQPLDSELLSLQNFLSSVRLDPEAAEKPRPMIANQLETVLDDVDDGVSTEERFISSMAAVVYNMDPEQGRFDKATIQELIADIDMLVEYQLNEVIHHPEFQMMEANWTAIQDLVRHTNFKANIGLSLLDITKEEAFEDLELNYADIAGSELFKKIYIAEYDQYGGAPFGGIIGLYDFANTPDDILWLRGIGKVATAAHAPFIGNLSPRFLGCETMAEVSQLRDIEGMLDTPKYSAWNDLREEEVAAYIGLTMPRVIIRTPYNAETNPVRGMTFNEHIDGRHDEQYLWAPASVLFARNLVHSFENSGWCQHIRGPKGGGLLKGLSSHQFNIRGEDEVRLPVEISIPDFRELELANSGIIPLIQKKGSSDAVFFSAQSIKRSHQLKDPKDSENSRLVTNLSYTFSISRIAHYLKCIMRDNIGSTANAQYVYNQIDRWVSRFVTALVNPDDLTLRYYPFKAYSLSVEEIPGRVGWYHCDLSILPHIQFEGMDVDLRIDARLG